MQQPVHQELPPAPLTPRQISVLKNLASGMSVSAAAAAAGLHRTTVHHWCRTSLPFASTLRNACAERVSRVREDIDNLTPSAIQALREALEDPNTPQSIRLRAALAVLKHATANNADAAGLSERDLLHSFLTRPLPAAQPPQHPAQQQPASPLSATAAPPAEDPDSAAAQNPSLEEHSVAPLSPGHSVDDAAFSRSPRLARTPRNQKCPCGSGMKFKKCCLDKLRTRAPAA